MLLRSVALGLQAASIFGCVHTSDYPDDWPRLRSVDGDCPNISGEYFSTAGRKTDRVEHANLAMYVHPDRWNKLLLKEQTFWRGRCVKFEQHGTDRLEIEFEDSEQIVLSRDEGDFSCDDGKIWIETPPVPAAEYLAMYSVVFISRRIGLARTEGGSLVGNGHTTMRGVFVFTIPAIEEEQYFLLWRSCEQSSRPSQSGRFE